jgi:hypothetical protein
MSELVTKERLEVLASLEVKYVRDAERAAEIGRFAGYRAVGERAAGLRIRVSSAGRRMRSRHTPRCRAA